MKEVGERTRFTQELAGRDFPQELVVHRLILRGTLAKICPAMSQPKGLEQPPRSGFG